MNELALIAEPTRIPLWHSWAQLSTEHTLRMNALLLSQAATAAPTSNCMRSSFISTNDFSQRDHMTYQLH